MVRTFQVQGNIEFADPQAVFSFLYEDDTFVKTYHRKITDDPDATATSWSEDGVREVHFTAPLDSRVVRKVVGADFLIVKEVQKYRKGENIFTITSELFVTPGGDQFYTTMETVLSPGEKRGCTVTVNVELEFKASVWGLQGSAESFMEGQARASFEGWMTVARSVCEEKLGLAKDPLLEEAEEFFDIEDDALGDGRSTTEELKRNPSYLRRSRGRFSSPSGRNGEYFVQTVLKELSILQISSQASLIHLEKLNAELLKIEKDLFIFKALRLYGLGIATGLALGLVSRR